MRRAAPPEVKARRLCVLAGLSSLFCGMIAVHGCLLDGFRLRPARLARSALDLLSVFPVGHI